MSSEPIEFEKGCIFFDAGEYFQAHEVWERLWLEASGARRLFLQGLIQLAVALHHAEKSNFVGCRRLLVSSLDYLEKGRDESRLVDVEAIRNQVRKFEAALARKEAAQGVDLPFFTLPFLKA